MWYPGECVCIHNHQEVIRLKCCINTTSTDNMYTWFTWIYSHFDISHTFLKGMDTFYLRTNS